MRFRPMRFLKEDEGGGGGGATGVGANGLPFVPNVATTSPSSTTSRTVASPGFSQALEGGEAAFNEKLGAAQNEAALQQQAAKIRANINEGYGPMAGVLPSDPQQHVMIGGAAVPVPQDIPDPFETKRAVGQAAREAAYMQELQRQKEAHDLRVQKAHEDYDRRYADAVEAQKLGGFWESKTDEQKSKIRLGMFLSAIGSGLSGKDNAAMKFVNEAIERDTKAKQSRAERLMRLSEQSKGALADAYRERAEALQDTTLNHAAMLKGLEQYAESYIATMLPAQQRAQAEGKLAELKVEANKWLADGHKELNTKISTDSGHTVTTEGLGNQGRQAGAGDQEKLGIAQENYEKAKRLEELLKDQDNVPTPDDLRALRDRENTFAATQAKEEHSTAAVWMGKFLRAGGVLPKGVYPEDWTPGKREASRLMNELGHARGSPLYGVAGFNPESYGHTYGNIVWSPDDNPKMILQKPKDLIDNATYVYRNMLEATKGGMREQALHPDLKAPGKVQEGETQRAPSPTEAAQIKKDLIEAHKAVLDPNTEPHVKAAARRFIKDHEKR